MYIVFIPWQWPSAHTKQSRRSGSSLCLWCHFPHSLGQECATVILVVTRAERLATVAHKKVSQAITKAGGVCPWESADCSNCVLFVQLMCVCCCQCQYEEADWQPVVRHLHCRILIDSPRRHKVQRQLNYGPIYVLSFSTDQPPPHVFAAPSQATVHRRERFMTHGIKHSWN